MIVVHDLPASALLQQKKKSSARIAANDDTVFRDIVCKLSLPKLEINARLKIDPEQTVAKHLGSVAQSDTAILPTDPTVTTSQKLDVLGWQVETTSYFPGRLRWIH